MNTKIYLVLAIWDYECSEVIQAFERKDMAEFSKTIYEGYHSTRPAKSYLEDLSGDLKLYHKLVLKYLEEKDCWESRHPAGQENASCDSFAVKEVPFVSAFGNQL